METVIEWVNNENVNLNEDEFESKFNKRRSDDPIEEAKRNLNLR